MMVNKAKNTSSTIIGATLGAVLVISIFIAAASFAAATVTTQSAYAFQVNTLTRSEPKAPMAVSQDGNNNIYLVWWTNRSGNWEVMFRASNDGGQTFGPVLNLGTNGTISTTGDGNSITAATTTG